MADNKNGGSFVLALIPPQGELHRDLCVCNSAQLHHRYFFSPLYVNMRIHTQVRAFQCQSVIVSPMKKRLQCESGDKEKLIANIVIYRFDNRVYTYRYLTQCLVLFKHIYLTTQTESYALTHLFKYGECVCAQIECMDIGVSMFPVPLFQGQKSTRCSAPGNEYTYAQIHTQPRMDSSLARVLNTTHVGWNAQETLLLGKATADA